MTKDTHLTGICSQGGYSIGAADSKVEIIDKYGKLQATAVGKGVIRTVTEAIDASGGNGYVDFLVLPANSVITDVHVRVTGAFNGGAAQTINIGIAGTTNKYLATADIETAGNNIALNDEEFGSTVDKAPVSEPAGATVRATWTNSAAQTTGAFRVSVSYYVEDIA